MVCIFESTDGTPYGTKNQKCGEGIFFKMLNRCLQWPGEVVITVMRIKMLVLFLVDDALDSIIIDCLLFKS